MFNDYKYLPESISSNDIHITIDNFLEAIIQYRFRHNKFVSEPMYQHLTEHTALNVMDTKALIHALTHATVGNVINSTKGLYFQSLLLASQLANPQAWASYPIIDKLHITVDVTQEEVDDLYLQSPAIFKDSQFQCSKTRPKRQDGQFYTDILTFSLKTDKTAQIRLFFGDNAKQRKIPQNKLAIEFIPSRFKPKEVKDFFRRLKRSNCIKKYKVKMQEANVSRCDVAIDFLFVNTPLVIVDKSKVQNFSNHRRHEMKNLRFVQTIYICDKCSSHIDVYNKPEKLLELPLKKVNQRVPLLINNEGVPLIVTRFENVYRPQQSGTTLLLNNLGKMRSLFQSVQIYNPDLLGNFDGIEKELAFRNGVMVYLKNKDNAAFTARREMLQRHTMFINHSAFKSMQEKVLRKLRKCIIFPEKDRK
jgi:hypothetical protein